MNEDTHAFFEKKMHKAFRRIFAAALALGMSFCTACALILPAATLDEKTCVLPEHSHTQECYTQVLSHPEEVPVCSFLHTHTDACRVAENQLLCGYPDGVIHTHDPLCFDAGGNLWCSLPELEAHVHSAQCYAPAEAAHSHSDACYAAEQEVLICTEHQHTDACYAEQVTLICDLEESEGHTHGPDCLDPEGNLICEHPQSEGHRHSEDCYTALQELVCGFDTTHQHTEACCRQDRKLICGLSEEPEEAAPELICGKEEIQSHHHTPECTDSTDQLICGKPQIEVHQHSDGCFETVDMPVDPTELTCGLPEDASHTHGPLCFGEWALTCPLEPHTHSEACRGPDAPAEPETPQPDPAEEDTAFVEELELRADSDATPIHICRGETFSCTLRVKIGTYTDGACTQGRVKLEFLLPLTGEEAEYSLPDMPWLDNTEGYAPEVTEQVRSLDGEETVCLVLTGYKLLIAEDGESGSIPEAFTETVVLRLKNAAPGKTAALQVSAAMTFNCWDGVCSTHQAIEKRTATAPPFTAVCSEAEMQQYYARFLEELAALDADGAEALILRLREARQSGCLSEEQFSELSDRVFLLRYGSPESLAEAAAGSNWISLRDSGWFEAYAGFSGHRASARFLSPVPALWSAASAVSAADSQPSDVQIRDPGGSRNSADGSVSVSKTISGTELENVFDITLQVRTSLHVSELLQEPDLAVVIVMDISNTMKSDFGGVTRYAAAMDAAELFLNQFAANNALGISRVGFVAFNTNAHQIFPLQPCSGESEAGALINTMRLGTGNIINYYATNEKGDVVDHTRFTNVEAGLAMANDMLSGTDNRNKYIVFLSDGFPTTYISSGYSGYDPYDATGRFYDHVLNKKCLYGTSYSDEAAIRARQEAEAIKASGVRIFSVGVDIGGQTIQQYITQSENANGFSVVDRSGTTYEIGDAASTDSYKNWLRNSIGSGYYYDSTDSAGLNNAFGRILEQIQHEISEGAQADWVTKDPLPSQEDDTAFVEFIGFYDKAAELAGNSLTGTSSPGGENTAVWQTEETAIRWDLKNSGYQESTDGGSRMYTYQLRYRVRLKNEASGFAEAAVYPTNGKTTLQYRIVQTIDQSTTISEPKTIDFPIPSVAGYLVDLRFRKQDSRGNPLAGAEFTLRHHPTGCTVCRGDETPVPIADMVSVSGDNGAVCFSSIPSGHLYSLEETGVPEGYSTTSEVYVVSAAYDGLLVSVIAADGSQPQWDGTVTNNVYYVLPNTGGPGTLSGTAAGIAFVCLSAALSTFFRIKRRKEGRSAV